MTRATLSGVVFGTALLLMILLALAGNPGGIVPGVDASASVALEPPSATPAAQAGQGVLYGRVTTEGGATLEGRLRFGGDEEAFWGHYFNGVKSENPWLSLAMPGQSRRPLEIFGIRIPFWDAGPDVARPLMARFGDIARIEAEGRDLRVTLKSGTVFPLDRFAADDFADGLRVWDRRSGVVDLDEWQIRSIEFLPAGPVEPAPARLHGRVRTREGDFTGFIQWDRAQCVGADELVGRTADGEVRLRFDSIRAIERRARDSAEVILLDGREVLLSGTRQVGDGYRGMYVDDGRYGRVLVSWDAFERIEFGPGGSGPAYTDFPAGRLLSGRVTTRDGRRTAGRLVFDLDESETTETLDAPSGGVDYTIPFSLIASIATAGSDARVARRATVTLHDGEALRLEPTGDLGAGNAGLLIFLAGRERPEYVPWADVERIDFERPPSMYPPIVTDPR